MTSASFELQAAIVTDLKAHAPLMVLAKGIYDRVQQPARGDVQYPYLSWGPEQVIADDSDCIDGLEIYLQLDVWSVEPGFEQVKTLADVVKRRLHRRALDLGSNSLVSLEWQDTRYLRDPDGLTSHAAIGLLARVEEH
jgi:hypothetical protein